MLYTLRFRDENTAEAADLVLRFAEESSRKDVKLL